MYQNVSMADARQSFGQPASKVIVWHPSAIDLINNSMPDTVRAGALLGTKDTPAHAATKMMLLQHAAARVARVKVW